MESTMCCWCLQMSSTVWPSSAKEHALNLHCIVGSNDCCCTSLSCVQQAQVTKWHQSAHHGSQFLLQRRAALQERPLLWCSHSVTVCLKWVSSPAASKQLTALNLWMLIQPQDPACGFKALHICIYITLCIFTPYNSTVCIKPKQVRSLKLYFEALQIFDY